MSNNDRVVINLSKHKLLAFCLSSVELYLLRMNEHYLYVIWIWHYITWHINWKKWCHKIEQWLESYNKSVYQFYRVINHHYLFMRYLQNTYYVRNIKLFYNKRFSLFNLHFKKWIYWFSSAKYETLMYLTGDHCEKCNSF